MVGIALNSNRPARDPRSSTRAFFKGVYMGTRKLTDLTDKLIARITILTTLAFKEEFDAECARAGIEVSSAIRPALETALATVRKMPNVKK